MIDRYDNLKYEFVKYQPSMVTIYNHDRAVLLREPSLLAVDTTSGAVLALGKEAHDVHENGSIAVGSPLRNGIVADFEYAKILFHFFLWKATGHRRFFKPRIAVCAPKDMTKVERQALTELTYSIGAKNNSTLIIAEPFEKAASYIPESYKLIIEISFEEENNRCK